MHLLLQTFAIPELFGFPRFEHQISSTLLNWYTLVFWLWSVLLFSFFIMVVRSNLEITDAYRRLTYLLSWFCASADKEAHHIQIASVRYTGVCVYTSESLWSFIVRRAPFILIHEVQERRIPPSTRTRSLTGGFDSEKSPIALSPPAISIYT